MDQNKREGYMGMAQDTKSADYYEDNVKDNVMENGMFDMVRHQAVNIHIQQEKDIVNS